MLGEDAAQVGVLASKIPLEGLPAVFHFRLETLRPGQRNIAGSPSIADRMIWRSPAADRDSVAGASV